MARVQTPQISSDLHIKFAYGFHVILICVGLVANRRKLQQDLKSTHVRFFYLLLKNTILFFNIFSKLTYTQKV